MTRPVQAVIDIAALQHNLAQARRLAGDARVMAVVKADAYGHDLALVARALETGVDAFGVECIRVAERLQQAGIGKPVVLLEGFFTADELPHIVARGLHCVIHNERQLAVLEQAAPATLVRCWLKLDSGMHRLGFPPSALRDAWERLRACPAVADDIVLMTHLSDADSADHTITDTQLAVLAEASGDISAPLSVVNSAGLLQHPALAHDWVRPGLMLYGLSPFAACSGADLGLRPVMRLETAVVDVRTVIAGETVGYGSSYTAPGKRRIAVAAVGYGDGYPRELPNGTPVLVNGQRAALAGRVSMDMITIDVSALDDVSEGDAVVLWGDTLPAEEIARAAGTIPYTLTCAVAQRVPRVVSGDENHVETE